mgnify:CR=1 FL=1
MKTKATAQGTLFFSQTLPYLKTYLPRQMGRSPETIRSYTDSLTSFRKYLLNEKGISIAKFTFEQCTKEIILEYFAYLKENGISPATCNVRLSAIKNYVNYVADNDVSLQSIALKISKITALKVPKREKKLLSIEALTALLAQPSNTKIGLRNKTIMILLYDSAIRLQELIDLNVNDIDLEGLTLHIASGKGNKERTVAITKLTAEHMKNYMSVYHKEKPKPESFLFYTVIKGKIGRISSSTIERFIQNYADEAREACPDMPDRVYPHLLRAERTTNLYRDGVDPILLAQILGHADIETTKIYTIPSTDQLREAMEKVPMPADAKEKPLWEGDEDEMARNCGLR